MFFGDIDPWLVGASIAIACLLIAGFAMGHFDPFDYDIGPGIAPDHAAADSMAEWACVRSEDSMHSVCERAAAACGRIESSIESRAAREAAVLGLILDEDGDVDTLPPLSSDRQHLLAKINRLEPEALALIPLPPHGLHAFPVDLIGDGVSIPRPCEVLA